MQKHHDYTTLPTRRASRVRPALRPALDDLHSRQTRRRRHTRPGHERLEERSLLSLVAAYNFDAGSGTVLADVSGNGNNGTITDTTWSTAGKLGGSSSVAADLDPCLPDLHLFASVSSSPRIPRTRTTQQT